VNEVVAVEVRHSAGDVGADDVAERVVDDVFVVEQELDERPVGAVLLDEADGGVVGVRRDAEEPRHVLVDDLVAHAHQRLLHLPVDRRSDAHSNHAIGKHERGAL